MTDPVGIASGVEIGGYRVEAFADARMRGDDHGDL